MIAQFRKWVGASTRNGDLLVLAEGQFDVFLTDISDKSGQFLKCIAGHRLPGFDDPLTLAIRALLGRGAFKAFAHALARHFDKA